MREALELAEKAATSPSVEFVGIAAFEGTVSAGARTETVIDRMIAEAAETFFEARSRGWLGVPRGLLSIGGSAYFNRVTAGLADLPRDQATIVLRSGCYVTHDCGIYDELSPLGSRGQKALESALEVWGAILSTPEPGLAIANFGKRHVSFDAGLPTVKRIVKRSGAPGRQGSEAESASEITLPVTALNDHHAFIKDPDAQLHVGDLVGACISHPCTTFDKWRRTSSSTVPIAPSEKQQPSSKRQEQSHVHNRVNGSQLRFRSVPPVRRRKAGGFSS